MRWNTLVSDSCLHQEWHRTADVENRRMARLRHRTYLAKTFAIATLLLTISAFSIAWGQQGSWDLRVCVSDNEPPASDRIQGGYEEKIAGVLAAALGARLDLVYTPGAGNGFGVQNDLAPGACDMIMGAPEGAAGVLNTVPYYRAPYVFLYRADAPFSIQGLDHPVLGNLKVAAPPNSLLASALQDAGFGSSVVPIAPDRSAGGDRSIAPLVDAVETGSVDAAVVYGPYASRYVARSSSGLKMVPVTPEITGAGYAMFHIETIGVRPGDDSLQRELNNALASGWDQIQGILEAAGMPTLPVPRPVASPSTGATPLMVGVILPLPTGVAARTDGPASLAQAAATLAENFVGQAVSEAGGDLKVRFASSPDADAAARAARRLVLVDHVSALVGGLGEGQAKAIASIAKDVSVPFFNVADGSQALRACQANTFNVAASSAMELDALARWSADQGYEHWFLVSQGADGDSLVARAGNALARAGAGGQVVGTAALASDTSVYYDVFDKIRAASPDLVVLLMDPVQQGLLLSEVPSKGIGAAVTGLLPAYAQGRDVFSQLQQDNPTVASGYRVVQWDPAVDSKAAQNLNKAFMSQAAAPIDASGWSTFMAVKIVGEASIATKSVASQAILGYLADPSHSFDLDKGVALSFRPWNHQLRQPLYVVKIDPNATWSPSPSDRVALASVTAEIPSLANAAGDAAGLLDTLGDGPGATTCK